MALRFYNKEMTYIETYTDDAGKHRWRLYTIDKHGEKDTIGASHQGWDDKQQCLYNARYICCSQWEL